jgi:hypothetical protein
MFFKPECRHGGCATQAAVKINDQPLCSEHALAKIKGYKGLIELRPLR